MGRILKLNKEGGVVNMLKGHKLLYVATNLNSYEAVMLATRYIMFYRLPVMYTLIIRIKIYASFTLDRYESPLSDRRNSWY